MYYTYLYKHILFQGLFKDRLAYGLGTPRGFSISGSNTSLRFSLKDIVISIAHLIYYLFQKFLRRALRSPNCQNISVTRTLHMPQLSFVLTFT